MLKYKRVIAMVGVCAIALNVFAPLNAFSYGEKEIMKGPQDLVEKRKKLLGINDSNSNDFGNRLIIKFKEDSKEEEVKALMKTVSNKEVTILNHLDIGIIDVEGGSENVMGMLKRIESLGDVEYAEPDYVRHIAYEGVVTNDELSYEQWYLDSINAPQAWSMYDDTDDKVIVSVNDTGIDYSHPDIAGLKYPYFF